MIKNVTEDGLIKHKACSSAIKWFKNQAETDSVKIIEKLIDENKYNWASWGIVRLMTYKQYVSYAVYAAEQVYPIYAQKYPEDIIVKNAITAAKKCITNPSNKNKTAASEASKAASWAASRAAPDTSWSASRAASEAARSASWSALGAARAASGAASWAAASWTASWATASWTASGASRATIQLKILKYGLKLIKS